MRRGEYGLPYMTVQVDDITGNMAAVKDSYGKRHDIRIDIRRGKGPLPRVGEIWLVDKTLGPWSFAACIESDIPVVSGSTDDIPALRSLIATLAGLGLIRNETTDEPIRSVSPHVHSTSTGTTGPDQEPA